MEKSELESRFKSVLPNKNFCTPYVDDYFQKGKYIIELSYGGYAPQFGGYPFGVTVVDFETKTHCVGLCQSFIGKDKTKARKEAMEYIESFC